MRSATPTTLGIQCPLLIRSPGYHTGQHFLRIARPSDLAGAIGALPGEALLAIEFLDIVQPDEQRRKYRVMCIDGRLYPLHMAISKDWKVHYFSADMFDHPSNRAEEEVFLRDMPRALGPQAVMALESIFRTLGLDYAGIDFALDACGNVVVFEANATMVLSRPPDDARFEYRRAPVERAFDAVRTMLRDKALAASGRT